jgi:glycosyltransferase involved in cell wall biosynthesis
MSGFRTLIFHPALAPYRIDLFNRLHERIDMRVIFFSKHVGYYKKYNQDRLQNSLKCRYGYLINGISLFERDLRTGLGKAIDKYKPDVVVSHEFAYSTLANAALRKLGTKYKFGHLLWTDENSHMLNGRGFIRLFLRRICCSAVDGVIVNSDKMKEEFLRFKPQPNKIFVCANLQDEKCFADKLDAARRLVECHIKKYELSDKKIVLFVGRLVKPKNLPRLIDAFSRISKENVAAVLVLVGDGSEKKILKRKASSLGILDKVLFVGHQEEAHLYVWYLLATVFVLPSIWEPYGAVVNEALMAGVPVLCSSCAGANVLISDCKNGRLFNPYGIGQLAYRIGEFLTDSPNVEDIAQSRRGNLMPVSFERDVTSFINAVESVAQLKRG